MESEKKMSSRVCNCLSQITLKFVQIILTITNIVTLPILFLLNIFLLTIRLTVKTSVKIFHPELGKMVTTRGQFLAIDDIYSNPKANIVIIMTLSGNVDCNLLRETFEKNIINARFPDGSLKYPELKQYLVNKAGYYFWKDDKTFDLRNHFKPYKEIYDSSPCSEEDLEKLRQDLVERPWPRKKPLWEFVIVPNFTAKENPGENSVPHTVILLKFHHTIGDGYSWVHLLTDGFCEMREGLNPVARNSQRSFFNKLFYFIKFPFAASYEWAGILIGAVRKRPFNPIKSEVKEPGNSNICMGMSDLIAVSKIKEIKSEFGTSFASVVFASVAGGMREILKQKGLPVPSSVKIAIVLPLPNHSDKLRNYMTVGLIKLPIGKPDPLTRLRLCQRDYIEAKNSTLPLLFSYLMTTAGCNVSWLLKSVGQPAVTSVGISLFPVGAETYYCDHKVVDVSMAGGLQVPGTGLIFGAITYVDGIRISATADTSVLSKAEVDDLLRIIFRQIDILHEYATGNQSKDVEGFA